MKQQRGLMGLVDDLAPVIAASFAKALAPVLSRLEVAEKCVAELEARPLFDIDAVRDDAIGKVKAEWDGSFEKIATAVDVVRDLVTGLPGPDGLAAMVDKAVDAKVATIPPATPGKDADLEVIKAAIAAAMATLPVPKDGRDVDPAAVRAMVDEAVAALPGARDGNDADPEAVRAMVADAVAALPKPENGKDATPEAIAAAVEKVLAAWERPKDGESVTLEQLQPVVDAAVQKAEAARPAPKDGVGLAGVLKDHEGCVVFTLTDGSMVKLGRVDGEPGKNGLDGLGFDDLDVVDDGMAFTLRFSMGDQVKEFRIAKPTLADMHKGVWREGTYQRGSVVTWGGSTWLAKSDTEAKPETNDAWLLVTKRGRDGKDSVALEPKAPAPVKLR